MPDFSKIGRNNKNRGRAFERSVAELLKWQRVPYSGGVKEWGGGDVVDGGLGRNAGLWASECKTQQPGPVSSISIKKKWVSQMLGAATDTRRPILIVKNVKDKVDDAFVFMLDDTFEWFVKSIRAAIGLNYDRSTREDIVFETKLRGEGHNFVVQAHQLAYAVGGQHVLFDVKDDQGHVAWWYVFRLCDFAQYTQLGIMKPLPIDL